MTATAEKGKTMAIAWKLKISPTQPAQDLTREWLECNGLGGYASSTVLNCHTRKYHGLLVSRLTTPPGTWVLLNQLEEWLQIGEHDYSLSVHQYDQTYYPDGAHNLREFSREHAPRFIYDCGQSEVTRELLMLHERDVVLLRYSLGASAQPARLRLWPQFSCRSIHDVISQQSTDQPQLRAELGHAVAVLPHCLPSLHFHSTAALTVEQQPHWYERVLYARDAERGLDCREDLFAPGFLSLTLPPNSAVIIAIATADIGMENLPALWQNECQRRQQRCRKNVRTAAALVSIDANPSMQTLLSAADQHLIRLENEGLAVHAGYHWFGPWGRDLLIALPGLAFIGGNPSHGQEVLQTFAAHEQQGLLPNFIHADGTCVYTAADPSLWFFWSVQQYMKYGGDLEVVRRQLWPVMKRIISAYQQGTENRIGCDSEGLLRAGAPGVAVSWMDVQLGSRPILARWGYMVELNALWYNALCYALELSCQFDDHIPTLDTQACCRVRDGFISTFWDSEQQYLVDSVNEFAIDRSIRPNQLLAVSLPYSPLTPAQQHAVVELVYEDLFTPYGLRTLSPDDPRYHPNCQGANWYRELAYHQGSACFWLLAHFADACKRVYGKDQQRLHGIFAPVLAALSDHFWEAGIGSISEIFDGDPPHSGRGAISQAWNIGEAIRLLYLLYQQENSN